MNIVMGFSYIGGEMERLVLLVLFFKGGKRGSKGVQREAFFCDYFCFMARSSALHDSQLCNPNYYKYKCEIKVRIYSNRSFGSVQI